MIIFKLISFVFFSVVVVAVLFLVISVFPIAGNYRVMVVQSGSMEPAIKTGSVVAIRPVTDYQIGDVISFADEKSAKMIITHRIVEIKEDAGQKYYITKGDANSEKDFDLVSQKNIVGKVFFTIPYFGYVVHTAKQPYGFLALVVIPSLWIIIEEVRKIRNEVVKIKKEKSESV